MSTPADQVIPSPTAAPQGIDLTKLSDADLQALAAKQRPERAMSDDQLRLAYQAAHPVSATDRAHAAEGGILGGLAYAVASPLDAVANTYNLGKAGLGAAYQAATGHPGWDVGDPNPVGHWLTGQMDQNPLTSTQAPRPDDTASRYLNTAGYAVGGAAAGGGVAGDLAGIPRSAAAAVPGALAGQAIAEKKPFANDTANTGAQLLAQVLGTYAGGKAFNPRGAPLPENQIKNDAVTDAQALGAKFPPGTTNPSIGNVALSNIAGKTNIEQNLSIPNQKVANEAGRSDMGLPPGKGGAITDIEIADAKKDAAPGYDALRTAGTINPNPKPQLPAPGQSSAGTPPPTFGQQLDAAAAKQSGAGRLAAALQDPKLNRIISQLKQNQSFDAGDAMDAIDMLREKASEAYASGRPQAGRAYKATGTVIENAIDQDLTSRGGAYADMVSDFRDSRKKFAVINTVEENRDPTTGNIQAQKLAAALKRGDYLGDGDLDTIGRAAGQAPQAFAQPTKTPGNHLGAAMGMFAGPIAAHEFLPTNLEHHLIIPIAAASAIPAARAGLRATIQGPLGQRNVLPRAPTPVVTPGTVGATIATTADPNR